MEKKKEYLSEEQYLKNKEKIKKISLIVLIVGLLIGASIIIAGVIKSKNYDENISSAEEENVEETKTEDEIRAEIAAKEAEMDILEKEKTRLDREASRIFMEEEGYTDNYYAKVGEAAIGEQITDLRKEIAELETEIWEIDSGFNSSAKTTSDFMNKTKKSIEITPYYSFGGFIILVSFMASGLIYFFAIRREVAAFTTQQVMPIAQEGTEKMAPSIGKVAKEAAKGVREGIKDN